MSDWPPFSSDEFLDLLRDEYFPRARKAIVECEGVRVRTLVTGKNNAVSGFWPFPFYLEPLPADVPGEAIKVPYLKDVVVAVTAVSEPGPPGTVPSPFVRWDGFETWEEYLARCQPVEQISSAKSVRRAARRIERDIGRLTVATPDDNTEVFRSTVQWKRAQYARTGLFDPFTDPRLIALYDRMRRGGLLQGSSLRADGRLIAGHLGNHLQERVLYRLPSFDPSLRRYSGGHVLLLNMLRRSFEAGDQEFDFLMGREPYKLTYATHVRWVGSVGSEGLFRRGSRITRGAVGTRIHSWPAYRACRRATDAAHAAWSRLLAPERGGDQP